jgi:glycosyltransferase involved in cell wall biosynthesis
MALARAGGERAPTVSVVIPVYNGARFIGAAIESVLAQTVPVRECLVVDDGSEDGTAAVVSGWGAPVRVLRQPRAGVAEARNRGLREARGSHVAFLDADDVWLPAKLERQQEALDRTTAGASICGWFTTDADLRTLGEQRARIDGGLRGLLAFQYAGISGSTLVAERSVLERLGGFDRRLSTSADWDMVARLLLDGPVAVVEEPLVLYRQHGRGMHRDVGRMEQDMRLAFDKVLADARLDAGVRRERRRWWAGLHAILAGSYLEARQARPALRHGLQAMRLDPARAPHLLCRAAGALWRRGGLSTAETSAGTEADRPPRRAVGA